MLLLSGLFFSPLIEIFGPISGAHFNPAVSLAMVLGGKIGWKQALIYIFAQVAGGLTGTVFSHLMFYHKIPQLIAVSEVTRAGGNYFAELLGTFILVLVIFLLVHHQSDKLSLVVGMLVGGQLIATSSTMFANPQVTFARIFTYAAAGVKALRWCGVYLDGDYRCDTCCVGLQSGDGKTKRRVTDPSRFNSPPNPEAKDLMSIRWVPVPLVESATVRKNDKRDLPSVAFPSECVLDALSALPRPKHRSSAASAQRDIGEPL